MLVRTATELQVLRRYLEVVGAGEYFWSGYQYSLGQFVGVDGEGAPSVVTDNIGSSSGASEDDLCLALGSDGMFRNDSCSSSMLRYICLVEKAGKRGRGREGGEGRGGYGSEGGEGSIPHVIIMTCTCMSTLHACTCTYMCTH